MSEPRAYYNEHDPYAAEWLRNLINAGHIAPGVVDERDIRDVRPSDLDDFTQCHFFAGIGIWQHALRRAGWPDDRPLWTGSCPCQPFSAAGGRRGVADERHLWPHWLHLIRQCRPPVVLGEQVASKDGLGWLDLVSTDLEGEGYAFGASDLCAAGFGGAHIRQRLYFVGVAEPHGREWLGLPNGEGCERDGPAAGWVESDGRIAPRSELERMADSSSLRQRESGERDAQAWRNGVGKCGDAGGVADDDARSQGFARHGAGRGEPRRLAAGSNRPDRASGPARRVADPMHAGRPERGTGARIGQASGMRAARGLVGVDQPRQYERSSGGKQSLCVVSDGGGPGAILHPRQARSLDNVDWLLCRNPAGEPSWRPVEPGSFPLAHGVTARMGKLRAYGNGLDAETATGFVEAVMGCIPR